MYLTKNMNDTNTHKISFDHIWFWLLQYEKDNDTSEKLTRGLSKLLGAGALDEQVETERAWLSKSGTKEGEREPLCNGKMWKG